MTAAIAALHFKQRLRRHPLQQISLKYGNVTSEEIRRQWFS